MKKTYALASLLLLAPVVAQAQEEAKIESSGEITVGIQQMDVDPDSSKFNKNRDLEDGFNLYDLWFGLVDPNNGRYLDFQGENLLRDDQSIRFGFGSYGSWGVVIDRNEIPHNLSNKARTPYIDQGGGLLTLPSTAPIPNTNLVPSAAQLTANDAATATWLSTTLHGVELGTQRDKTGATISITPHQDFKFRLSLSDERKDGSNLTYGAIGDRPPRTLNAQLAEPIDYKTQELKFEAEYNRPTYQALFTYLLSGFENEIDTLRWQNPYVADVNGGGYDPWASGGTANAYNVASFGQRALAPDNRYQNASLALGIDLPMASRLSATVAYGKMEQDETLLPYST
ncbi:MAG: MtrB/PioB family outer membrane beta-barrel protein, partial [Proteobacteria bacterium]|nr:MtrB/PioB family outer membrane beta-barrel protein [Pseudomonadota bacterium]